MIVTASLIVSEDKLAFNRGTTRLERGQTQFGRLLEELGIESISANSPQAKGRVERLWGTFQDRLTSELRLAGARTIDEANLVLTSFLPDYNRRFAVTARDPKIAYRQKERI